LGCAESPCARIRIWIWLYFASFASFADKLLFRSMSYRMFGERVPVAPGGALIRASNFFATRATFLVRKGRKERKGSESGFRSSLRPSRPLRTNCSSDQ
jgi:hypothetical protein